MNPLQAIAYTVRSFIRSRRLQRAERTGEAVSGAWILPEEERYADEVGDLIALDLANVRIQTKDRILVFNQSDRLDLHQSLEHLRDLHPEVDLQVMESELLFWVEQNSEPEGDGLGFTKEQMDKHNQMVENWFDDYYRQAREGLNTPENS